MRVLLDEDVPVQLTEPLRHMLPEHQIDHVQEIRWKGKKDLFLLPDAGRRGYGAFLTHNSGQLDDARESRAIRDSGMHLPSDRSCAILRRRTASDLLRFREFSQANAIASPILVQIHPDTGRVASGNHTGHDAQKSSSCVLLIVLLSNPGAHIDLSSGAFARLLVIVKER